MTTFGDDKGYCEIYSSIRLHDCTCSRLFSLMVEIDLPLIVGFEDVLTLPSTSHKDTDEASGD